MIYTRALNLLNIDNYRMVITKIIFIRIRIRLNRFITKQFETLNRFFELISAQRNGLNDTRRC